MELLTDSAVEAKLLERVQRKASTYGQEIGGGKKHSDFLSKLIPVHSFLYLAACALLLVPCCCVCFAPNYVVASISYE